MAEHPRLSRRVIAVTIISGLIAGLLGGWWSITRGMGGESYSGWYGSRVTGSKDAGARLRARVAVSGLLALTRDQAIYFTRKTDDQGLPLRENCRYTVNGAAIPGRWWSITVYARDNYLPQNEDDALSFDATEVQSDPQGQWSATLAPVRPAQGAWASTRNAGAFDITLRIYQPTVRAQGDYRTIPMPTVTRLDCRGGA